MAQVMQQLGALSINPPSHKPLPRLKEDKAAYEVAGKGFFTENDNYLYPGQALYFEGEPNFDLIPLNRKAWEKMQEFLDKIDSFGVKTAKAKNEIYRPSYSAHLRKPWDENSGEIEIQTPDSVLGARKSGRDETIR